MIERRQQETKLIQEQYGEIEVGPNQDWVIIKHYRLPTGWSKSETELLVLIPPGHPLTPPDNFWTDNDLRLEGGAMPGSASPDQVQIGRQWLQFSYHIEAGDWQPHADLLLGHNLLTFLAGAERRLSEKS